MKCCVIKSECVKQLRNPLWYFINVVKNMYSSFLVSVTQMDCSQRGSREPCNSNLVYRLSCSLVQNKLFRGRYVIQVESKLVLRFYQGLLGKRHSLFIWVTKLIESPPRTTSGHPYTLHEEVMKKLREENKYIDKDSILIYWSNGFSIRFSCVRQ